MDKIKFNPEAFNFSIPKDVSHEKGVLMIHHWIIQKGDALYAKWKAKPENQQSTEDPAALKQRLYSEFEESNTGITILLIEPEEDEEDVSDS